MWCPNLLKKGVAATVGPVAEPYTIGFPKPSEFFGALATVAARVSLFPTPRNPWGAMRLTAAQISRMCSGVVPQHPPTSRTPFATNRLAYDAMYSGEHK